MKRVLLYFLLIISTGTVANAYIEAENAEFYKCLKTCADYNSETTITYNNGNNRSLFWRSIKKDNNKCVVTLGQSTSSVNPPADSYGTSTYQFPMHILKKININNFYEYAKKYYDEELSH